MSVKVALISCPMWDIEFPPYNIALLSAVLRKNNFEADCFDLNGDFYKSALNEQYLWSLPDLYAFWQSTDNVGRLFDRNKIIINKFIIHLEPYQILGFTLQSLNFIFSIKLINAIKETFPQKIILGGGPECFRNFSPENLMQYKCFDAICCGEGELSLPELLSKIKNAKSWDTAGFFIKKGSDYLDCGNRELVLNLDDLPFADYRFLDEKTEKISISTSRGCVYNCSFCHEKAHWSKFRYRSAESIIREIILAKERFPLLNFVYLNDSLINGNMKEFEKFCDLMISENLGINWGGHILVCKEMTRDFIGKMKLAGAQRLNFGIESGSDAVLKLMHKSFNRNLALRVLEDVKESGISFSVNLVVGHPGENEDEFNKTYIFVKQIKDLTDCIHINPCYVLKGSDLHINYDRWGIMLPENYVTDWYLSDGSNNLQIRMDRVNALKNL